ncbi:hypothetical protein VV99743_03760 [Vibrio vulnificus]|nr:hypothetical protein VV99743_03760 [Vibrio vulnificus]
MRKMTIDGIEVTIENHTYKTRYCRLVIFVVFLLVYGRLIYSDEPTLGYVVVFPVLLLLFQELYRMMFNPTLLSILYEGIYHHKGGFISWSDVCAIDYYSDRNKGLCITTTKTRLSYRRFLHLKLFESTNNLTRFDMSFSECNVREACNRARIMHAWYEANHTAS